jgi:tetratricopeptide (TPR) repeat protein
MAGVDPEGIRRRASAAREAFDRAIAVKEDAPLMVMKSRCLQLEARDDDALKAARRAHELDPAHAEARLELVKLLLLKYRDSRSTPGYSSTRSVSGKEINVTFERLAPETSEQRHLRQEAEHLLAQGGASPALANLLNGLLAMGREDYQAAADAFASYTKLENWDARGFQLEGMSRFLCLKFQAAISAFDQSLLRVPRGAAHRWRGQARHFQGLYPQALEDLTKAIELDRNDAKAYDNRGVVLSRMGRYDEAISDYTKAIELDPKAGRIYVSRGVARRAKGLIDEAMTDFTKAIALDPADSNAYSSRGTARSEKGDLDGAIADYTKAVDLDPKYTSAWSNRGSVKFSKGLFDEAIEDFSKAIALDPGIAAHYTNRGAVKAAKKLYDEAIADHNRAIELEPDLPEAYGNRAYARRDKGLLRPAIEDFETFLKLMPPDWPKRPEIEKALDQVERRVLPAEGDELFAQGNFREGIRRYAKFVEKWPESTAAPYAALNCACALAQFGEKAAALEWLEKAVKVGWKDFIHLENNPSLASLRDDDRYKKLVSKLKGE